MSPEHSPTAVVGPRERSEAQGLLLKHMSQLNQRLLGPWEDADGQRRPRLTLAEAVVGACCDTLAWARRAARAVEGSVAAVPHALAGSPRAPCMPAPRVARLHPS